MRIPVNASPGEICLICFTRVCNGIIKSIWSCTTKYDKLSTYITSVSLSPAQDQVGVVICWQGCHKSQFGSCPGFWNIFFWCRVSSKIILCDRWHRHDPTIYKIWEELYTLDDIIIISSDSSYNNTFLIGVIAETTSDSVKYSNRNFYLPSNYALISCLIILLRCKILSEFIKVCRCMLLAE